MVYVFLCPEHKSRCRQSSSFRCCVVQKGVCGPCPNIDRNGLLQASIDANLLVLNMSFDSSQTYWTAQGLFAKTAKDGVLPPVPLLITSEGHLQLAAVKHASRSIWTRIRAKGTASTAVFLMSCGIVVLWFLSDDVAAYFPGATERVLDLIYSIPGGAFCDKALRLLSRAASNVFRALNPFDGARDALRLHPVKVCVPPRFVCFFVSVAASFGRCVDQRYRLLELCGTTCCSLVPGVAAFRCVSLRCIFAVVGNIRAPVDVRISSQRVGVTPSPPCLLSAQLGPLRKERFRPVFPLLEDMFSGKPLLEEATWYLVVYPSIYRDVWRLSFVMSCTPAQFRVTFVVLCACPVLLLVQGVIAAYIASAGWMMAFVYVVAMLGTVGNGIRRVLPVPSPVVRLLRSSKVAVATVCAVVVAAHVETFSLPPAFREVTLKGELWRIFSLLVAHCTFVLVYIAEYQRIVCHVGVHTAAVTAYEVLSGSSNSSCPAQPHVQHTCDPNSISTTFIALCRFPPRPTFLSSSHGRSRRAFRGVDDSVLLPPRSIGQPRPLPLPYARGGDPPATGSLPVCPDFRAADWAADGSDGYPDASRGSISRSFRGVGRASPHFLGPPAHYRQRLACPPRPPFPVPPRHTRLLG